MRNTRDIERGAYRRNMDEERQPFISTAASPGGDSGEDQLKKINNYYNELFTVEYKVKKVFSELE